MTGSLRQRGANSWELRVYQGIDPTTGRRRYATRTVRGSRTQAQRELVDLAAAANVAPIVGARTTIAELLERWFATSAPNWAPTTVRNTRSIIDRYLTPGLGTVRVRDLTTVAIDDFYSRLRTNGRHDAQPLSTGTVRRVHAVLHRALAQAMRWDWIWTNPAAAANKPAAEPTEMRPPTPAQINALLAHAAAHPAFHLFLVLAATTGARRGELLALRWADIDLARGSIAIQRALVEGPTGPTLAPTKTRRPHHLELDTRTLALLRAHHDAVRRTASGPVDRDRFVFTADAHGAHPWRPNWVTKRFIATRTAAGLGGSGSTISATSWQPRCSTSTSRCLPSRAGWPTPACRQPSTSTPTPCPAATAPPPPSSPTSSSGPRHPSQVRPQPDYTHERTPFGPPDTATRATADHRPEHHSARARAMCRGPSNGQLLVAHARPRSRAQRGPRPGLDLTDAFWFLEPANPRALHRPRNGLRPARPTVILGSPEGDARAVTRCPTAGGRIFYFVDDPTSGGRIKPQRRGRGSKPRRRVIIEAVHPGHPKGTERKQG